MIKFFKKIGKGIGYIFLVPFYLVVLTIFAVVGLFILLYLIVKGIFLFFTGRSLRDELPEDRTAQEILERAKGTATPTATTETVQTIETSHEEEIQQQEEYPTEEIEEIAFEHEQEPVEEDVEEIEAEETPVIEPVEEEKEPSEELVIEQEEEIQQYTPLTNSENANTFFKPKTTEINILDEEDDEE